MTDDKSKQGARDRSRVSGSEDYEVEYFAKKHGLTAEKAREIIKQAGGNRAKAAEYYGKLVELAKNADAERQEVREAKAFLARR